MKIVEEVNYGFLFLYRKKEKMSIKVVYDNYSDVCKHYVYGKTLLDLPDKIIDRLDEHFDGVEFKQFDGSNPDNVAINSFTEIDTKEALIDFAKIINHEEFEQLVNEERLFAYVEEHEEEIINRLNESYTYLGYEGDSWFLLQ